MPDILLKNKDGEDVTYSGIETVTFDTPTQEKGATFTYGTAVENVPIELDLADGNQKVTLPDGELAKSAIIQKPSELSPENIKIGVKVAGVEGEFIGNGVSKTVDLNFIDDSKVIVVSDESEIDELRNDTANVGKYVKYEGLTNRYEKNAYYKIALNTDEFDKMSCPFSHGTYLGSSSAVVQSFECNDGDLIIMSFKTDARTFTLTEGWELLHSVSSWEDVTGMTSFSNYRVHTIYKKATRKNEQVRIDLNGEYGFEYLYAIFPKATGAVLYDYDFVASTGVNSITVQRKPSDILFWTFYVEGATPNNHTFSYDVRDTVFGTDDFFAAIDDADDTSFTVSFTNSTSSKTGMIFAQAIGIIIPPCVAEVVTNVFIDDSHTVVADENTLMDTVVINRPDTLIPQNIINGVNIAGVVGTYESPKLAAPTSFSFSKDSTTNLYRLGVAYPQFKNGQFGKKAQVLLVDENDEYEIVAEADIPVNTSQTSTTPYAYVYANNFICGRPISGKRIAKFVGDVVAPSDVYKVDTDYSLGHLKYNLGNVTVEPEYEYGFYDDALSMNIVPEDGYHLPKTIRLETPSGEITTDYTYDYDTGELVVSPKQPETISVNISAVDTPWLRTPYLYTNNPYKMSDPYLKYTYIDPNATNTTVSLNGETILENLNDTRTGLIEKSYSAVSTASYGFSFDGTYYKSGNSSTGTAALCQVNLNMKTAGTITITYVNYGYSSYDYGIIGKVDAVLSTSYGSDIDTSSSTKVYTTFKSNNSTSVKTLTMSVPAGEHFIQFKYRRYSSSSSSYYFKFYVSTEATPSPSWSLANHITNYGSYPLQIQSFADGYTDSDISSVNIECRPTISVSNGELSLSNTVDGVTDIELYIDDELTTSIPYVDGMTIDVEEYAKELSIDRHSTHDVSVSAVGEGVAPNKSNILKMYLGTEPVYGVSGLYSSTVALTRLDDSVDMTYTVNSNGTVTSDFDNVFPWNEAKIVYDEYNNKFIQMPRMYFNVTTSSSYVSTVKVSKHPHSSGSWYKVDPFCYGCYGGYLNGTKLESKSGKARTTQKTRANFRSYASANGDKYHQLDLYHSTVMKFLWWIEFATKDSVSVMSGRISGSGTSGGNSSRATGGTDKITTPSGYETTYKQMRWHYIEDFVGNFMELIDGVYLGYRSSSSYGNSYVTSDYTKYSDSKTDMSTYPYLYTLSGTTLVKGYWWNSSLPFLCLPDGGTTATTTYTTYFCDSMYIATSSTNTIMYGGATYYYNTNSYGLSYMTSTSASTAPSYTGARLLYRGALDDVAYEQTLSGTKLTVNGFDSITQTETGIEVE